MRNDTGVLMVEGMETSLLLDGDEGCWVSFLSRFPCFIGFLYVWLGIYKCGCFSSFLFFFFFLVFLELGILMEF